jgi:pyrroloquinoline-quinone synthase
MTFSSKDFSKVSNYTAPNLGGRLIHKNVLAGEDDGELQFSKDRRHLVRIVDLPTKTMSMTIGGLEPSESSGKHRHNYESIIYIMEGQGETQVEDKILEWEAGDAIYIPPWAWHQHTNRSDVTKCLYLACENAPLLQNLGDIALREES